MKAKVGIWLLLSVLVFACEEDPELLDTPLEGFSFDVPAGFPIPEIPEDNELTAERVALGRALFFDKRLSRDYSVSCASCHHPEQAFTDGEVLSEGVDGRKGFRNSPTLANIAYAESFFMDGGVLTLEMQVLAPLDNEDEMDFNIVEVVDRLGDDERYNEMAQEAYGRPFDPFVITRSIAAFERTMISGHSRYDQFKHQGKEAALTASEKRGMDLFQSQQLGCNSCHSGFNFTNNAFENNGLLDDYTDDPGRKRISRLAEDEGKFKVPTLRNIGMTAPYMHDGSVGTLEELVDHYASGGSGHQNKSPHITGFTISEEEKQDLIHFLEALTDEQFLQTARLQDPAGL